MSWASVDRSRRRRRDGCWDGRRGQWRKPCSTPRAAFRRAVWSERQTRLKVAALRVQAVHERLPDVVDRLMVGLSQSPPSEALRAEAVHSIILRTALGTCLPASPRNWQGPPFRDFQARHPQCPLYVGAALIGDDQPDARESTTRSAARTFWRTPMPSAAPTRARRAWTVRTSRTSWRTGWSNGLANRTCARPIGLPL